MRIPRSDWLLPVVWVAALAAAAASAIRAPQHDPATVFRTLAPLGLAACIGVSVVARRQTADAGAVGRLVNAANPKVVLTIAAIASVAILVGLVLLIAR